MKKGTFRKKSYQEILAQKQAKQLKALFESRSPYYRCCITGSVENIQWHHNLIFKGKRVNEIFAILPVTAEVHRHEAIYKDELNRIMLNRATDEEIEKYSVAIDYKKLRDRLNEAHNSKR